MTRAVLFDVDGVLVHGYHAKPEKQIRWDDALFDDLGVEPGRFRREFIHENFTKHVLVGRMSLLEALDRILPILGCRVGTMQFVEYWLRHDSVLNEPLLAAIRQLKADSEVRLFIATNQDHMRAQWLWLNLGLGELFDDIFHSARVGALKPTRPYFEWVAKRMGPQSAPPLFFDDREEVVRSARDNGWEAVLYEEPGDVTGHPWIAARLQ